MNHMGVGLINVLVNLRAWQNHCTHDGIFKVVEHAFEFTFLRGISA